MSRQRVESKPVPKTAVQNTSAMLAHEKDTRQIATTLVHLVGPWQAAPADPKMLSEDHEWTESYIRVVCVPTGATKGVMKQNKSKHGESSATRFLTICCIKKQIIIKKPRVSETTQVLNFYVQTKCEMIPEVRQIILPATATMLSKY